MKQLIIFLLIIIVALIGYGKYSQYQRYNSPGSDYQKNNKIDLNYHNQEVLISYNTAIESLNSYVAIQWSANDIDVRTPEDDDNETKVAVAGYAKKMATVKYYEAILEQSSLLKEKGVSNDEIKFLEENGLDTETHKKAIKTQLIKSMFDPSKNGFDIKVDGIYLEETSDAIKDFEEKNKLFADGKLDALTVDLLIQ